MGSKGTGSRAGATARVMAASVGLIVLTMACGLGGVGGGGDIDGTMTAELAAFKASWTVTPTICGSGEHQGFFGVDLVEGDREDALIRVLLDPKDGYSLGINIPGEDMALFLGPDAGCEVFDLEVARESSRVNDYWNVGGHALVDCSGPGIELHVDLVFSGCH